jgi:hypothetical protein
MSQNSASCKTAPLPAAGVKVKAAREDQLTATRRSGDQACCLIATAAIVLLNADRLAPATDEIVQYPVIRYCAWFAIFLVLLQGYALRGPAWALSGAWDQSHCSGY